MKSQHEKLLRAGMGIGFIIETIIEEFIVEFILLVTPDSIYK